VVRPAVLRCAALPLYDWPLGTNSAELEAGVRAGIFVMSTLRAVLNARPKDRVIAAPGVYDMVSLRMAAAWRHHRVDRQCHKYACVTVFPGRRPSGYEFGNSDAGRGLIKGAPSSARPFGKKRRCISSGPISSLAWDPGTDPLGKRCDVGLTRPRDDVGRVDRPCYMSDLGRLLRLRVYIHCHFPSRLAR
jgi:hypothetical protein